MKETIIPDEIVLAFDMKLMKPGCVLLQALFGSSTTAAQKFDSKFWLLAPTPDMKPYRVPTNRLSEIVKMVEDRHNKNP